MINLTTLKKFNIRVNLRDSTIVPCTYNIHGDIIGLKIIYPVKEKSLDANSLTMDRDGHRLNEVHSPRNNLEEDLYQKNQYRTVPRYEPFY